MQSINKRLGVYIYIYIYMCMVWRGVDYGPCYGADTDDQTVTFAPSVGAFDYVVMLGWSRISITSSLYMHMFLFVQRFVHVLTSFGARQ